MIGRSSLRLPVYSPICARGTVVFSANSRCHCSTDAWLEVTISVSEQSRVIAASPTSVLPDPHGRTTTPAPAPANAASASA